MSSEKECKKFARLNYHPKTAIHGFWDPKVQAECAVMNSEIDTWVFLGLSEASAIELVAEAGCLTIENVKVKK